jgi:DNA mismatch repair protein MutL
MPKVLVLPDHIASQIAAGEVVERPASVVKELVENSVDAGATAIEIAISADCRDIRIADNGCGMDPEDAVLAFQRHATSKLRSADDLWSLNTLGFRGEAIPSIASISKFSCTTRGQNAAVGTRVETADGELKAIETGCSPGTIMEVQELFYNTPARLKFMKKANTEFGHIHEIVQSLAISYPSVAFNLVHDGDTKLRTTGSGSLQKAIVEAGFFTGKERLAEVDHGLHNTDGDGVVTDKVRILGYLAKPTHFRGDRKGILTIVNGRAVRCPLTYKALDYVYSDLIPRGRYPLAVVRLEVAPGQVDVNIHPTKKELKYSNGNEIYITIQRALGRALREESQARAQEQRAQYEQVLNQEREISLAEPPAPSLYERTDHHEPAAPHVRLEQRFQPQAKAQTQPQPQQAVSQINFRDSLSYQATVPEETIPRAYAAADAGGGRPAVKEKYAALSNDEFLAAYQLPAAGEVFVRARSLPAQGEGERETAESAYSETFELPADWKIIGYLRHTYIMIETSEGLEIVEQHIAHERTLYERLLATQKIAGRITEHSQKLIVSAPLALRAEQLEVLKTSQKVLEKLGFAFEIEDDKAAVSELPLELARVNYVAVIQKLIDDLSDVDAANLELEATKSIACQSAIKNGMPLSQRDILKLLNDWLKTERNDTCPHGRPVRLKFSMDKLFQMFHPA